MPFPPRDIIIRDPYDALLKSLMIETSLGRGPVIEIALEQMAEAWAARDRGLMANIAERINKLTTMEIAQDALEIADVRRETTSDV